MRYSCPLLARQNILLGKVPTTPTIASIIGGMQSQEALKLIHGMPVEPGKVIHFNGMVNEMHTTAYVPREDCESHWTYGEITELPARAERTTLEDLLRIARADLGPEAVIELDQELITSLECPACHTVEQVLEALERGQLRSRALPHLRNPARDRADPCHHRRGEFPAPHPGQRGRAAPAHPACPQWQEYRFYELTGDLPEALHFRHFEQTGQPQPGARPGPHQRRRPCRPD